MLLIASTQVGGSPVMHVRSSLFFSKRGNHKTLTMHSIVMSFPLDPVWNLGIEFHSNNHNLDTNLLRLVPWWCIEYISIQI